MREVEDDSAHKLLSADHHRHREVEDDSVCASAP